jgi:hypothetical protein
VFADANRRADDDDRVAARVGKVDEGAASAFSGSRFDEESELG